MRFSCDACHAQYLISDEKVGSSGVRVRCKKCGHVIVVKRQAAVVPPPAPEMEVEAPVPPDGPGLDAALGSAFEGLAASGAEGHGSADEGGMPDPDATRVFPSPELPKREEAPAAPPPPAAPPSSSPLAVWFVAIDDEQVGPIAFEEVKRHWEAGAIGPLSLCWRAGLADWTPIGEIVELVNRLPTAAASVFPERPVLSVVTDGPGAPRELKAGAGDDPWDLPAPQPTGEFEWKPSAGSALSALVQEEVVALARPPSSAILQPTPEEVPPPESTGIRSLLSELPEPPPAEPSRVIPFPARSQPGSQPLPKTEKSAGDPLKASSAVSRRSVLKNALVGGLVAAAVVVVALVALAWTGILPGWGLVAKPGSPGTVAEVPKVDSKAKMPEPGSAPAPASAPVPEAAAAPVAAVPSPSPAVAQAATPEPVAALEAMPAPPAPSAPPPSPALVAAPPATARVVEAPEAPVAVEPHKSSRRERPAPPAKIPAETKVARAAPSPTPSPGSAAAPSGGRSDIDDLFDREFSGSGAAASKGAAARTGGEKRGDVYIPEAPGSAKSKPERLGQGDVMAVVVGHKAAIKKCVEGYKTSGGDAGTLVMVWTIQPSGKTAGVKPKGSDHAPLAKCIGGLIQGWQFPEYGGATMAPIEFPFQF